MIRKLVEIDKRWEAKIGRKTRVGVGINTGKAHVGNTGSLRKFKYGPLGNTVNLASRVQNATKQVKCGAIITENTRAQIGDDFGTRRLCQVKVINIPRPVELFELAVDPADEWREMATTYETALESFDQRDFRTAVERFGQFDSESTPTTGQHWCCYLASSQP